MAAYLHAVLLRECDDRIWRFPGITVRLWMDRPHFHRILGGDAVELLDDQLRLGPRQVPRRNGHTDRKKVLVSILQCLWLSHYAGRYQYRGQEQGEFLHTYIFTLLPDATDL